MAEMTGRVCLVTGATHGIGEATAEALARMGATLVVHGRSPERVDEVCRGIRARTHNGAVSGVAADYESLDEVRRMAEVVRTTHPRLDVLVNNAGGSRRAYQKTRDGFEWHFGVNHLAPFLLTRLLLDTLTASPPARVVVVSSEAHRRSRIDLDDLNFERGYGSFAAYGRSKSANILFTVELANRLRGTSVTANALHPGVVRTNIFAHAGWLAKVLVTLMSPVMLSAEDGARTPVYLASSPDVVSISGRYFIKCREAAPSPSATDPELARRLWEQSEALTGLAGRGPAG